MNNLRTALTRFHHPLEAHGMVLRHRRSHDQNRVRVLQILLCGSSAAAPERCPQTGDSGAMSYTSLVADAHHSQPTSKQLLDQIIFFIVESGSAKMCDSRRLH